MASRLSTSRRSAAERSAARPWSSTAAAHPDKVTCDTKHHHDLQTTWTTASYTNGTTPLTLHEEIEGAMTLPDSTNDGFIQRNSRLN